MSLNNINKAFGVKTTLEEERKKFILRVETGIFNNYLEYDFNPTIIDKVVIITV